MTREKIIVTLTSYSQRMNNLPTVLDTIFAQTVLPDKVVLNLAFEETIPNALSDYIDKHDIEVFRVQDTKVYKKLIPTLLRYPEACVISVDDDWFYPQGMIEDFMDIHQRYPNNPISGNREVCYGMQCHCGCASLTKKEFFGDWLDVVDETLILNCPCDDLVYSYFASRSGHPYIRTKNEYFINMTPCNEGVSYSETEADVFGMERTMSYLNEKFGEKPVSFSGYIEDKYLCDFMEDLFAKTIKQEKRDLEGKIRSSYAYRFGKFLLRPFSWIRKGGKT